MHVKTGLQAFLELGTDLSGARVGLVTHPAAVLPDYRHSLDALQAAGLRICALFGPEHGYLGFVADAGHIDHTVDPRTGLPVYSLYGSHMSPTLDMLEQVDMFIFDMQDVGVRFYTFISTLFHIMKSAGVYGKPVLVFDRPNPLGGNSSAGPMVEPGYESFVGIAPLPVVHGMTTGEIAMWMNARLQQPADLRVIAMQGWRRSMYFQDSGLAWVPTSPGIPHLSTVFAYPCTCLLEGTNLSEGRGTPLPFEVFGAPWLDGYRLANELNALHLDGVSFRPTRFIPSESKHAGSVCQGLQMHISDPHAFRPLPGALAILKILIHTSADFRFLETSWEGPYPHFDLLAGNSTVRSSLLAGTTVENITAGWEEDNRRFNCERQPFLLYD